MNLKRITRRLKRSLLTVCDNHSGVRLLLFKRIAQVYLIAFTQQGVQQGDQQLRRFIRSTQTYALIPFRLQMDWTRWKWPLIIMDIMKVSLNFSALNRKCWIDKKLIPTIWMHTCIYRLLRSKIRIRRACQWLNYMLINRLKKDEWAVLCKWFGRCLHLVGKDIATILDVTQRS